MKEEREKYPVDEFQDLYGVRQRLESLRDSTTNGPKNTYDASIEDVNKRLEELVNDPEVRSFLVDLSQPVTESIVALRALEMAGMQEDIVAQKISANAKEREKDPRVAMALEFIPNPEVVDENDLVEWRSRSKPSKNQLKFARSLGLDVDETTPRGQVRKIIDREVKKLGREELEKGGWTVGDVIEHVKYGTCEVAKIHQKSVRVTLWYEDTEGKPKTVVVNAYTLKIYRD